MRVKSRSTGEAFNVSIGFNKPIITIPGQYNISIYTLINCGKAGCENAQDTLSIKVKDGENGDFNEQYSIRGSSDEKWLQNTFLVTVTQNRIYVS